MKQRTFFYLHRIFVYPEICQLMFDKGFQRLLCGSMGAGIVLRRAICFKWRRGRSIVVCKVLLCIGNGFLNKSIIPAEMHGGNNGFRRNLFTILGIVSPLPSLRFTGWGKQDVSFFSLLRIKSRLIKGATGT